MRGFCGRSKWVNLSKNQHLSPMPPPCLSHNAQINPTQPAITCLKLTKETLEQGVKYVQS